MEQDNTDEIQELRKEIENAKKERDKALTNIESFTSCPKKFPTLFGRGGPQKAQINKRFNELASSLKKKIQSLKDDQDLLTSDIHLTKRRRVYNEVETAARAEGMNMEGMIIDVDKLSDEKIDDSKKIDDDSVSISHHSHNYDSNYHSNEDDESIKGSGDGISNDSIENCNSESDQDNEMRQVPKYNKKKGTNVNSNNIIEIFDSDDEINDEKISEIAHSEAMHDASGFQSPDRSYCNIGDNSKKRGSNCNEENDFSLEEDREESRNPNPQEDSSESKSLIESLGERGDVESVEDNLEEMRQDESQSSLDGVSTRINDPDDNNIVGEENDDEEDDYDLEHYHRNALNEVTKIRQSKLTLAIQGFRTKLCDQEVATKPMEFEGIPKEFNPVPANPESITYKGRQYFRERCYRVKISTEDNVYSTVGILRFLPDNQHFMLARCVLIVPYEDTILGTEDSDVNFMADFKPCSHVQVHQHVADLPITELKSESEEIQTVPSLIYEPQVPGNWQTFGYFLDKSKVKRRGKRRELRMLEIFVGAGGMHQGYINAGFKTVMAVDNDKTSIQTFKANCKRVPVFEGDVKDFLEYLKTPAGRNLLGKITHVHFSPPCQGFSGANRLGSDNDLPNNELSMLIVEFVRVTKCTTAVFENVLGMWRRKHMHYVKNIAKELLKLGYQVRCTALKACDYGDPQKRPRFFLFITHKSAPPPFIITKTHGDEPDLLPFVTVKDALSNLQHSDGTILNMNGKISSVKPGNHGVIRLDGDGLAPTIRARSVPPYHYNKDRCINVREAASLQSFPVDYIFHGDLASQYRQVGNAVPVELATAVAQSVRNILIYEYENEDL